MYSHYAPCFTKEEFRQRTPPSNIINHKMYQWCMI